MFYVNFYAANLHTFFKIVSQKVHKNSFLLLPKA